MIMAIWDFRICITTDAVKIKLLAIQGNSNNNNESAFTGKAVNFDKNKFS